ncbi:gastrokine-1 [Aquila chrysaetos chrysaetos]|uniref:gastrokine-1 n=1 Tax=Aquila chrysaetos chrysaetos TaxID=223781 RepID=UPI0011768D23|nr:gastrokine-1 [Aquila chrysaetos chrysaetos]
MTARTPVNLKSRQHCDSQNVHIVTSLLLGLLLTPALATSVSQQAIIGGDFQILTINKEWHVATIEKKSTHGSWKTIWHYDTGFIATRVLPEKVCFVSIMKIKEMPSFDALPALAEESRQMKRQGRPAKEITFIIRTPVRDLMSYGPDIFAMCNGLKTYVAYEVHEPQDTYSQGSCIRLDVLHLLGLNYCRDNTTA